jgi:hypothetical protein
MTKTLRVIAVAALVAALAGCGGGGDKTPSAASTTIGSDMAVKFAQCMREHGVNVPDPKPGQPLQIQGDPNDTAKIQAAQEACKAYAPQQDNGGQQSGDDMDRQAKLVACLRQHGVTVEDPQPGQPLRVQGQRQNEAATEKAMQDCQREVGGPAPSRIG